MVELLDENDRVISGYEKELCYFQDVDDLYLPLVWDGKDGAALAGQTVSLRFYIRDARVYAVTTKEPVSYNRSSVPFGLWNATR